MNRILALLVCAWALLAGSAPAQAWKPEVVDRFAHLPVMEKGRVKPIHTYAYWLLLQINGRGATKTPDGRALTAQEWLLDALFFPERAEKYECFLIENDEVLDAIGVAHEAKNKRDRYSYATLAPARSRLMQLGNKYVEIAQKDRTVVQEQIVRLANMLVEYEWVRHYLDGARGTLTPEEKRFAGRHLAIVPPPPDTKKWKEWYSIGEIEEGVSLFGAEVFAKQSELAKAFADLVPLREKPDEFGAALVGIGQRIEALASPRGEIGKVALEVTYYKLDLVYRSLYAFGFAFLLCAFWWLKPRVTKLRKVAYGATALATLVLTAAITLRCILRERPPVTTLYETILFITATLAIVALVMEAIQRRGLALSVAAVMGFAGVYLANRYELGESTGRVDTMPTLVAVLDTNFWLATHVTTVTIGYSAGLLAAGIAHVYLLGKFLGFRLGDKEFYAGIARSVYGVICFGLFFSVVGTILGGVWANDSWGRFWGWDPKENGALLICLGEIAILHARMGGYLRHHGLCMAAVFNGCVVAASWWGVNLLGVGLHSYGFTSGVLALLVVFWVSQFLVMGLGWVGFERQKAREAAALERGEKQGDATPSVPEPAS